MPGQGACAIDVRWMGVAINVALTPPIHCLTHPPIHILEPLQYKLVVSLGFWRLPKVYAMTYGYDTAVVGGRWVWGGYFSDMIVLKPQTTR